MNLDDWDFFGKFLAIDIWIKLNEATIISFKRIA